MLCVLLCSLTAEPLLCETPPPGSSGFFFSGEHKNRPGVKGLLRFSVLLPSFLLRRPDVRHRRPLPEVFLAAALMGGSCLEATGAAWPGSAPHFWTVTQLRSRALAGYLSAIRSGSAWESQLGLALKQPILPGRPVGGCCRSWNPL